MDQPKPEIEMTESPPSVSDSHKIVVAKLKKYLTFTLAEEKFAMPLSSVKEVIGITAITPLLHVPAYFKGLINLRGRIISVIDFRIKLGLPASEYKPKHTSIIISEIGGVVIGMIVDNVEEVVAFKKEQLDEVGEGSASTKNAFVSGVAKTDEKKLILLLDIEKVIQTSEINSIKEITNKKVA